MTDLESLLRAADTYIIYAGVPESSLMSQLVAAVRELQETLKGGSTTNFDIAKRLAEIAEERADKAEAEVRELQKDRDLWFNSNKTFQKIVGEVTLESDKLRSNLHAMVERVGKAEDEVKRLREMIDDASESLASVVCQGACDSYGVCSVCSAKMSLVYLPSKALSETPK